MDRCINRRSFLCKSLVAAPTLAVAGCGPVKGRVTRTVDGKKVTEEVEYENYRAWFRSVGREFVNPYKQIAVALAQAYKALRATIQEMIRKITEVPEPGLIRLADVDADLAAHAGGPHDYVGDKFEYVRIDVPAYDQFFESSMGLFAYTTQIHDSSMELRNRVGLRVGYGPVGRMSVEQLVAEGGQSPGSADLAKVVGATANVGQGYRDRIKGLRASGGSLVAGAKQSLIDPRVIAHLDLIVKGLKQSVEVIAESAKLLAKLLTA